MSKLVNKKKIEEANFQSKNSNKFGPSLGYSKPLEVKGGYIKKLIHYDCNNKKINKEDENDVPDENEIFVKENLLQPQTEEVDNNS